MLQQRTRWSLLGFAAELLLLACRNSQPAPTRATPSAAAHAAALPAAPASAMPPVAKVPPGAGLPPLEHEVPYRGALGSASVVLRFTRDGAHGAARFFSGTSAVNVNMRGAVNADASFELQADAGATLRGRFVSEDELSATLSSQNTTQDLRVRRVPARGVLSPGVIVSRRAKLGEGCSANLQLLELVGAFEPNIEARINHELQADEALGCEPGVSVEKQVSVVYKTAELITFRDSSGTWGGGNTWVDRWLSYTVLSGERLTHEAVFEPARLAELRRLLAAESAPSLRDQAPELFAALSFGVEAKGLRFAPDGGWPGQATHDDGIFLTYFELEKHQLLRSSGPLSSLVDRAFADSAK